MIGGQDIIIPTQEGQAPLEQGLRAIRRCWPVAIFEDAETGTRNSDHGQFDLGSTRELFIYRDPEILAAWDRSGASPELSNTMIHLITGEDSLTVVVDDALEPSIAQLLDAMRKIAWDRGQTPSGPARPPVR